MIGFLSLLTNRVVVMKKIVLKLCALILGTGSWMSSHAAPPPLQLQLNPATINGYMDNTACLRDKNQPCGSIPEQTGEIDITFRSFTGFGYFTVRNWDTSHVKLEPHPDFTNSEVIIRDTQGNPAYRLQLEGEFELTKKLIHIDQSLTWGWEDCNGNASKLNLQDALRGVPMRCLNDIKNSHLSGFRLRYVIRGNLYRLNNSDLRQLNLPTGLKISVNANGYSTSTGGNFNGTDTENIFNGGAIRLNDRKCFINLQSLKVPFGDIPSTSNDMLRKEVSTSIPIFCSGFETQINGVDRQINGAGIKNTINGISVTAVNLADGEPKKIAVPDQPNLFVEVGPYKEGTCNAASSIEVNGNQIIGNAQVNGPVWNNPGYLEGSPYLLHWRLCQKDIRTPIKTGPLKDESAAIIRIHYN